MLQLCCYELAKRRPLHLRVPGWEGDLAAAPPPSFYIDARLGLLANSGWKRRATLSPAEKDTVLFRDEEFRDL